MIVLVCGSRTWGTTLDARGHLTTEARRERIDIATALIGTLAECSRFTVLHGGAAGADSLAGEMAKAFGLSVTVIKPNWQAGRRAGIERNLAMLDRKPCRVLAFSHGSAGTQHTIDEARRRGIPVYVTGRERSAS